MGLSLGLVTNTIIITKSILSTKSNPNQRHLSSGDHGSQSWQNSRPLLKGTTFLKLPELHHHDDHVSEEGNDEEDDDCDVDDHDIDYEKDENERDGEK